MKLGGVITVVVVVLMTLGTLGEAYSKGPWFLHWLDMRWWWQWIATAYNFVDSVIDVTISWPEDRS